MVTRREPSWTSLVQMEGGRRGRSVTPSVDKGYGDPGGRRGPRDRGTEGRDQGWGRGRGRGTTVSRRGCSGVPRTEKCPGPSRSNFPVSMLNEETTHDVWAGPDWSCVLPVLGS